MIPLIISKKAENESKSLDEWEQIKDYGNKINEKTRNNKKINEVILIYLYLKYIIFS